MTWRKKLFAVLACVSVAAIFTACDDAATADQPAPQAVQGNQTTESYQQAANQAVPYPLSKMKGGQWLERTELVENLLRQNNKHRIAYVTLLTAQGQPIVQYTIQGMVFSLNSQLTPTQAIYDGSGKPVGVGGQDCLHGSYGEACNVVDSPGDNGTYGPEPDGIGFFTTEGVEVKWNGLYIETDAPQNITTKPLIIYDASSAKPSVTAGGVSKVAQP